jgi:hypothetical protein
MRSLGETQQDVLDSLREHGGYWHPGCGWLWDTHSGTVKIMESLLKRGLVTKTKTPTTYDFYYRYDLTEEGKK